MHSNPTTAGRKRRALRVQLACALVAATGLLGGCAVIAVADTAASIAVKGVGLAADAAIGTVRLTGRAVGAAADVVLPSPDR
jgi:acyl-coenzyme A thioesterase PaaI-like protein